MTILWILQGLLSVIFLFSGCSKAYFDENKLVEKGQTGVEGLSKYLIKFIGVAEIFGAIALIAPIISPKYSLLAAVAASFLGLIMLPAAVIHYRRNELKNVSINVAILICCIFIAYFR